MAFYESLSVLAELLTRVERDFWDPRVYGGYAKVFRVAFRISIPSSIVILVTVYAVTSSAIVALVLATLTLSAPFLASRAFRSYIGFSLDREMPVIMSSLLPLARFSASIADAMLHIDPDRIPPGFRFEVSRLKILASSGYDPVEALRVLASTSPSRSFSGFLRDYLNILVVGGSRTDVTMMFLREAIRKTEDQWRLFFAIARLASEIIATMIVSMPVLVPLMVFTGFDSRLLILVAVLLSITVTVVVLLFRPTVGSVEVPGGLTYVSAISIAFSSVVGLAVGIWLEVSLLILLTLVVELYAFRVERSATRAASLLREALEESRIGLVSWDKLREAKRWVLSRAIDALLESWSIAGSTRAYEALAYLYELHEEVRRSGAEARLQGLALASLITAALAITIYFLVALSSLLAGQFLMPEVSPSSIAELVKTLTAVTPLLLIPSAIVYREWLPTPLIPLLSMTVLLVLQAIL